MSENFQIGKDGRKYRGVVEISNLSGDFLNPFWRYVFFTEVEREVRIFGFLVFTYWDTYSINFYCETSEEMRGYFLRNPYTIHKGREIIE